MGTNAHPASAFAPVVGQPPASLQSEAPAPECVQPENVILSSYMTQGQWRQLSQPMLTTASSINHTVKSILLSDTT